MLARIPFSAIYIGGAAIFYVVSLFLIPSGVPVPVVHRLADPAKSTLDFLLEVNKLITALDTAVLAGAVGATVKGKDWSTHWSRIDGLLVVLIFLCVSVSYYGLYLGLVASLGMVYAGTIYPLEPRLAAGLAIQYHGTLLAVFLLGLVFTRMLEGRVVPTAPA